VAAYKDPFRNVAYGDQSSLLKGTNGGGSIGSVRRSLSVRLALGPLDLTLVEQLAR
jgi:hypothetical protein